MFLVFEEQSSTEQVIQGNRLSRRGYNRPTKLLPAWPAVLGEVLLK